MLFVYDGRFATVATLAAYATRALAEHLTRMGFIALTGIKALSTALLGNDNPLIADFEAYEILAGDKRPS
jgi:hypothetical protein